MKTEKVEADVLCIGGGIAGLMAAISAVESGAKVVVAEKANTVHSGAGGVGNDHFSCYIPEVHGPDVMPVMRDWALGQWGGRIRQPEKVIAWFKKTPDIVKLWNRWGIPMKYEGRYEFSGHFFPGQKTRSHLKYSGQMQKPVLTKEATKRGVKIINRVMVFELLGDDSINGAIGVHTREDRLIEFSARSVILGTGASGRLYPSETPGWMGNGSRGSSCDSGDGRAMAYRVGSELCNMEMMGRHAGPKYFVRSGQATWTGVVRDPYGKPVGPFVTKPDRMLSDMIIETRKEIFSDYASTGRGPLYMDLRGLSDADLEYMMRWMKQEGMHALLNHLKDEGIDLRKTPIEFMTYGLRPRGSIVTNVNAEASIKGLYAAGDESPSGEGISGAAAFGWIAGENAARYAKIARTQKASKVNDKIKAAVSLVDKIRKREDGPDWKEAKNALNQVMNDYAGSVRSETMLEAGLTHLRRLKKKAYDTMIAGNPHELARSLEVLNLFDLGELVLIAANTRQETRGLHIRTDYPYANPLLDKELIVKRINGQPVTEWK
ncbi:MAG: FAD-binding protein [Chloroflexota bacterium]